MHERETHLVAYGVITPDLGHVNLVVFAKAARDIHHPGWDIKVERRPKLREMCPLGQCFQMIDRLARLDLDHSLKTPAALE
jgi:hypothetical protein